LSVQADPSVATILLIGGGGASSYGVYCCERVIRAAGELGVSVEIADDEAQLDHVRRAHPEIPVWPVAHDDVASCVALAKKRQETLGKSLVAVASFREMAVVATAAAAAAIGVPWNTTEAIATVRSKQKCRETLRAAGFVQPACHAMEGVEAALAFLRANPGEWIAKPDSSFGSQGVGLVSGDRDSQPQLEWAASFGPLLLEEVVVGTEYSAEGYCRGGIPQVVALTEKRVTPRPHFAEVGAVVPASFEPRFADAARSEVVRALTVAGITHSSFHVEFWVTPSREIVLGELHARPAGDYVPALVEAHCGVDLFGAALAELVGCEVAVDGDPPGAGAIRVVAPTQAGKVLSVSCPDAVASAADLLALEVIVGPGDSVGEARSSSDRLAVVAASAGDGPGAERRALELAGSLEFEME
jgi:biotin carboxylase